MLLLPFHYEFGETLANLPFFYQEMASKACETMHVIQGNPNHLPEIGNGKRLQEFLLGGEADEQVEFIDAYANESEEEEEENTIIPWDISDVWLGSI